MQTEKAWEFLAGKRKLREKTFAGSHNIYTPIELTEKVVKKVDDGEVLVLFNPELAVGLFDSGFDMSKVTFLSDHPAKNSFVSRVGVTKYAEKMDNTMKFKHVIGNPPYTDGAKMLYAKFFEKALEIGETVTFVMPVNLDSRHDKLKHHNRRVKKHLVDMSDNVADFFNVGYNDIRVVTASKTVSNTVEEVSDPLDDLPLLYPERDRLACIKGDTDIAIGGDDPNGSKVIFKVLKGDEVIYKRAEKWKVEKTSKVSNAAYLVMVNHTPSQGRFNCAVLKNEGLPWAMWTFAFECNTLNEANKLKAWLQGPEIVSEIQKMFAAKGASMYTVSKKMLDRLPTYE